MRHFACWIFFVMVIPGSVWGQQIAVNEVVPVDDSLVITYTLTDTSSEARYRVQPYAIMDEDTVEMLGITGEVGQNISPGVHRFVWNIGRQFDRYRGLIKIHLVAFPNFTVLLPAEGDQLRPGEPYQVQWFGGNAMADQLVIDLYRYDDRIDSVAVVNGTDQYTWLVPDDIKTGKGYRLRFRGTGKTGIDAYGPQFVIKRKTKWWVFVVPVAVVLAGTAAILLLTRDSEDPLPVPEGPN